MVTKVIKLKTKELFQNFLDKNGYKIDNEGFTDQYFVIKKPKDGEGRSTYYMEDLLDGNIRNIRTKHIFFNFIEELLSTNEKDVALYQLIKKTPKLDAFEYNKDFNSIVDFLKPHQDLFFKYMARTRFLEKYWGELDKVLPLFKSEDHKIGVIETLTQTNTFKSLDTQKEVYQLIQKHIKNPSILDKYFNKINKIGDNQSVIDHVDTLSVVVLGFTEERLIGVNLNTEMEAKDLIRHIKSVSEKVAEQHSDDLKIVNTIMAYNKDTKQHTLNILCSQSHVELNKLVFEDVINAICRFNDNSEVYEYKESSKTNIIQKCKAFQLHEELQDEIIPSDKLGMKKSMKL